MANNYSTSLPPQFGNACISIKVRITITSSLLKQDYVIILTLYYHFKNRSQTYTQEITAGLQRNHV